MAAGGDTAQTNANRSAHSVPTKRRSANICERAKTTELIETAIVWSANAKTMTRNVEVIHGALNTQNESMKLDTHTHTHEQRARVCSASV